MRARTFILFSTITLGVGLGIIIAADRISGTTVKELMVFAGAAGKPAIEEVTDLYTKEYGVKVRCNFGGSGTMLSQIILAKRGDIYIPGSDDFMDLAERKGIIVNGSRKIICYLTPVICVQKGNPKGINELQDLAKPGLRIAIARPKAVCLGDIALEILSLSGLKDKIWPNIVTQAANCSHVAAILKLKQVDAIIGWDVFAHWYPRDIDIVPVPKEVRISRHIPAAVVKFAVNVKQAQKFVDFISSEKGKKIFKKYGYTTAIPKGKLRSTRLINK